MSLLLTSYVLSAYSLVWTGVSPARLPSYTNSPRLPKPLLFTFTAIGSFSAMPCLPLSSLSPLWVLMVLFAVCANVGFGASVVASSRKRFPRSHAGTRRSRDDFFEPACPSVYATCWIRQAHAMARMGVRVSPDADCRKTSFGRSASLSHFTGSKPHALGRPVVVHRYEYHTWP